MDSFIETWECNLTTPVDRYGNELKVGDTVDILYIMDVSIVMCQDTVVGFDPSPDYYLMSIGIFVAGQKGSVTHLQVRKHDCFVTED